MIVKFDLTATKTKERTTLYRAACDSESCSWVGGLGETRSAAEAEERQHVCGKKSGPGAPGRPKSPEHREKISLALTRYQRRKDAGLRIGRILAEVYAEEAKAVKVVPGAPNPYHIKAEALNSKAADEVHRYFKMTGDSELDVPNPHDRRRSYHITTKAAAKRRAAAVDPRPTITTSKTAPRGTQLPTASVILTGANLLEQSARRSSSVGLFDEAAVLMQASRDLRMVIAGVGDVQSIIEPLRSIPAALRAAGQPIWADNLERTLSERDALSGKSRYAAPVEAGDMPYPVNARFGVEFPAAAKSADPPETYRVQQGQTDDGKWTVRKGDDV